MIRLTGAELFVIAEVVSGDSELLLGELSAEQQEALRGEGQRSMTARSLIRRDQDGLISMVEELDEYVAPLFDSDAVLTIVAADPEEPPQLLTILKTGAEAVAVGHHSPGVFELALLGSSELTSLVERHFENDLPVVLSVSERGTKSGEVVRVSLVREDGKIRTSDGRAVQQDQLEGLVSEWFSLD